MAIEFRCHTCGKTLRTGDSNAGRPAGCPACGERLTVPVVATLDADAEAYDAEEEFETFAPPAARTPASADRPLSARPLSPHRGGMVLTFGVLSWTVCFLFGPAAWLCGMQDLAAMRNGVMDPEGEGITRAGMWLGIANVALSAFVVVVVLGFIGLALVVG